MSLYISSFGKLQEIDKSNKNIFIQNLAKKIKYDGQHNTNNANKKKKRGNYYL